MDILEKILEILSEQLHDNKIRYEKIGTDYWFGRLADSEELLKKISMMLKGIDC